MVTKEATQSRWGDMPQCIMVNRFVFAEAAQIVYDRAHLVISDAGLQDISVHKMVVDESSYVIVVGNRPVDSVWHRLVDAFAAGQPADVPDGLLQWLNGQRSE